MQNLQLTNLINDLSIMLTELNIVSVAFRLLCAIVCGGLIGLEREGHTRTAGFRTHALVCLGSTLTILISNFIYVKFGSHHDVARLGAQVISGIGFLGAGTIITSGNQKVKGLTTAAALWVTACIGLSIGIGFYLGGLLSAFLSLLVLKFLKFVDIKHREREHFVDFYIELHQSKSIYKIIDFLKESDASIISFDSSKAKVYENEIGIKCVVKVGRDIDSDELIKSLAQLDYVHLAHKVYV